MYRVKLREHNAHGTSEKCIYTSAEKYDALVTFVCCAQQQPRKYKAVALYDGDMCIHVQEFRLKSTITIPAWKFDRILRKERKKAIDEYKNQLEKIKLEKIKRSQGA